MESKVKNPDTETAIIFKGSQNLKRAIKKAAAFTDKENSSDFLRDLIESAPDVKKYLRKASNVKVSK